VFPGAKVILFGSYARGDYDKSSDFDICVLVPQITQNRSDLRVDMACTVRDDFPSSVYCGINKKPECVVYG
jgi:predicted nucleotidyltransferase